MNKKTKIYLTQKHYTLTDFTVILLNAVSFEAITENGKRTDQFYEIRKKLEDISIYKQNNAFLLNEKNRKQLFPKAFFADVLRNELLLSLLETITGDEFQFEVSDTISNSIQLTQSYYRIEDFVLIVFNCLDIRIRKQTGVEAAGFKSAKTHLRNEHRNAPKKVYSRGELNKICNKFILWLVNIHYCNMPSFQQASADTYNTVRSILIDILKSGDTEVNSCIRAICEIK